MAGSPSPNRVDLICNKVICGSDLESKQFLVFAYGFDACFHLSIALVMV